jgi:hypothetical protein
MEQLDTDLLSDTDLWRLVYSGRDPELPKDDELLMLLVRRLPEQQRPQALAWVQAGFKAAAAERCPPEAPWSAVVPRTEDPVPSGAFFAAADHIAHYVALWALPEWAPTVQSALDSLRR